MNWLDAGTDREWCGEPHLIAIHRSVERNSDEAPVKAALTMVLVSKTAQRMGFN
jgi:hypothetical protein